MALDEITIKRINTLHPKIRKEVLDAYTFINNKLFGKGLRLRFAYTTRTIEEQDELYAQGRTKLYDNKGKRLGKVTNAKGGQSIHNYHLAFDIVLLLDKDYDGVFETASWDTTLDFDKDGKSDWMECVDYFKTLGYEWGGDWKFVDKPHMQKVFGHTWKSLKAKYDKKDVFKETIDGKVYTYVNL